MNDFDQTRDEAIEDDAAAKADGVSAEVYEGL